MKTVTPFIRTAMRCTDNELEKIEQILIEKGALMNYSLIDLCSRQPYLINYFNNVDKNIVSAHIDFISESRPQEVYHKWDAEIFIKNLGGKEIEAPPTYDRAEMATKILCAMIPVLKITDTELIADDAVKITDALIERLNQKPQ